jgi:hypothetical protein
VHIEVIWIGNAPYDASVAFALLTTALSANDPDQRALMTGYFPQRMGIDNRPIQDITTTYSHPELF